MEKHRTTRDPRTACICGAASVTGEEGGRRHSQFAWEEVEFCRETSGALSGEPLDTEDARGWGHVDKGKSWYLRHNFVF